MLMTNLTKFTLWGALALAAFTACQKNPEEENPNFNAETQEVLTDFIFNVATSPATKQSATVVQQGTGTDYNFRGINDALLLAYAKDGYNGKILEKDEEASKAYDLDIALSANYLSQGESRRVYELALPLNTNVLLFYGKAILQDTTILNPQQKRTLYSKYGHMSSFTVGETLGSADFKLGRRMAAADTTDFYTIERMIAAIGTLIMNTYIDEDISATGVPETGVPAYGYNVPKATFNNKISWKDYGAHFTDKKSPVETGHDWYELERKLGEAFYQMTHINTGGGELRAGSGYAIARIMTDLWTVVNEVRCAEPMNEYEAIAKALAAKISNHMDKFFGASVPTDGGPVSNFKVNQISDLKDVITSTDEAKYKPTGAVPTWLWPSSGAMTNVQGYNLAEFPANFGLPRGATHFDYNSTLGYFYYPKYFNTSGMGGVEENGDFSAVSYYYPAELMYFGNSPIRTTTEDKKRDDYPQGAGSNIAPTSGNPGSWMNEGSWAGWTGDIVQSSTRAVAMKYNINYGTAMLSTTVKYGSSELEDNNRAVQAYLKEVDINHASVANERNKVITVGDGTFKLTGVIVGGQPSEVGWDFIPVQTGGKFVTGFVFDDDLSADQQTLLADGGNADHPVYTMLLDNYLHDDATPLVSGGIHKAATTQSTVYVALEFLNNSGEDFYGNYNLIQDGGYFYLIGELNPYTAPATPKNVVWHTDGYVDPPYNADGTSQKVARVFIQDFMTTATFKLNRYSLQHAYLTVPDLRAGSMSLGLSVDVSWEAGMDFDDVSLGGTGSNYQNPNP